MENESEKLIIELLQEIKQEQQKLNQRFDEMDKRLDETDRTLNYIVELIRTTPLNMDSLTVKDFESTPKTLIEGPIGFEDLKVLWDQALIHISEEISKPSFETWLKSTKLLAYDNSSSTITIAAPNSFARDWLENHYSDLIKEILKKLTNEKLIVEFVIHKDKIQEFEN